MSREVDCFGFYTGGGICASCSASKRCKAILVSDGFTIVSEFVDHVVGTLPEGGYKDTDRVTELVDQLLSPLTPLSSEEAELLGILGV